MKKSRLVFILVLIISSASFAQVSNQRLFDTLPFMVEHYAKRVALFESQPIVKGRVIFLGNSITEGGPWAELTGDSTVINRGIGGDITIGVLKRIDDVIVRKPSKLFILIGINDIGKDIPDVVIADNIRKIISRVKTASPDTKIYLQSILPVNSTVKNFPQHYDKLNHVVSTNVLLKKVSSESKATFIDIFPLFLNNQKLLNEQLTFDGLHLNRKGYDIWYAHLKKMGAL